MPLPRAVRIAVVVAAGLGAGAAAWTRLAPIEPSLDVTVRLEVRMDGYEIWDVVVKARGGETFDEVRVEPAAGPVEVISKPIPAFASGVTTTFRVRVAGARVDGAAVRVVQTGRVPRTYDAPLVETAP